MSVIKDDRRRLNSEQSNYEEDTPEKVEKVDISGGKFEKVLTISAGDSVDFELKEDSKQYDIIQVYRDGSDFYPVPNGIELRNISKTEKGRLSLSFDLTTDEKEREIYFYIILSDNNIKTNVRQKYSRDACENNKIIIKPVVTKFSFTDKEDSQKVYLRKGDILEIDWASTTTEYYIEEKKYCPISGGFYTITNNSNQTQKSTLKGIFKKEINQLGISYFIRLAKQKTESNRLMYYIHDILVCIVQNNYKYKYVQLTNDNGIESKPIWIDEDDTIIWEWDTKKKQSITQVDSYRNNDNDQYTELKTESENNFFWAFPPNKRGMMCHQFTKPGVYSYKDALNNIRTVIVQARTEFYSISILDDKLVHKVSTNHMIQFYWDTQKQISEFSIIIDPVSSVVPEAISGLTGIFDCVNHNCQRVDELVSHHFYNCKTFLMTIPVHGLYNFKYSNSSDNRLMSIVVENAIDNYTVQCNDTGFNPPTLFITQLDFLWFEWKTGTLKQLYQINKYGNISENSFNFKSNKNDSQYLMKQFDRIGVYYFTNINNDQYDDKQEKTTIELKTLVNPVLTIIVLPEIKFHYKLIQKHDFDLQPIVTKLHDFVIWEFSEPIQHNVIQLIDTENINDLISSHNRAVKGQNRQCLAMECVATGTYYFANPDFEKIVSWDQDLLISVIVIDPPFSNACFYVTNTQFIPNILYIAQNETVSWSWNENESHSIQVQSNDNIHKQINIRQQVDVPFNQYEFDTNYLYTFYECGTYQITSDRFQESATVVVYSESSIKTYKRRLQEPKVVGELPISCPFGDKIRLESPDRFVTIYYTLDGRIPTRRHEDVQIYNPDERISLVKPGLLVIRAYSTEDQKLASAVTTTWPILVMENEGLNNATTMWKNCNISLTASLARPNKIYGEIHVEPEYCDLIDHFELYVDDVARGTNLNSYELNFAAGGFAGGKQYEIHIVAYPIDIIVNEQPIVSNKRMFEISKEVNSGAPLISLAVTDQSSTIFLMWAHIGDHVSEYAIYVDNIDTKHLTEKEFKDFFGIKFLGATPKKKYSVHVEAKLNDSNQILKSNVMSVKLPLEMPLKEQIIDGYFPYISINTDKPTPDMNLETIKFERSQSKGKEAEYTILSLPINNILRHVVPTLSFKRNNNGITLYWTKKTPLTQDSIENYRIMLDNKEYGPPISPYDEKKFQVNLEPGKHECYVSVIPKDETEEILKTNVLKIDGPREIQVKKKDSSSSSSIEKALPQQDRPIPKLSIQIISSSAIRTNWYMDRPLQQDVYLAMYEVHVRGTDFPEKMKSDESFTNNGSTEHVWFVIKPPLEIEGISEQINYTIFVRAFFHMIGNTDIKYVSTTSVELNTSQLDPLAELLIRPLLKVSQIGNQSVTIVWSIDPSVDKSLIKGYRLIINRKPSEIFTPNQYEYELNNISPGSTNEIQVSVTSHPDWINEKISESVHIFCPKKPSPPKIIAYQSMKLHGIAVKWERENDDIVSYKIFLDEKQHDELQTNDRTSFTYEINNLKPGQTYSFYIKAVIGQKKLEGYIYQCQIESLPSNELSLKCSAPPKISPPRLERMSSHGIDIVWDTPVEYGDAKLTGYQILKDGKAVGKQLPVEKCHATITDLEVGNRYSIQVVPLIDHPSRKSFQIGEEYDPERHCHAGPTLDVEYTDLIEIPEKIWIENAKGHGAVVCWTPLNSSLSVNTLPDSYKLYYWSRDQTRNEATILQVSKTETNKDLTDLKSSTGYEIILEGSKRRRHHITNEQYVVVATSNSITLYTGSPPDPPTSFLVIACTNNAARISWDSFLEHNSEIVALRIDCVAANQSLQDSRHLTLELTPDSTEVILPNLSERTEYIVTVTAITDEYLFKNKIRDISQLPKKLKPDKWLPNKSLNFTTGGAEAATKLQFKVRNFDSIQLDWTQPKAYGSTRLIGQCIRWMLENSNEHTLDIDPLTTSTVINGLLPSGYYTINLDSIFSVKINLEPDNNNDSGRKQVLHSTNELTMLHFQMPAMCEKPELYLTGYSTKTINFAWNKPNMFTVIDHPEKVHEQVKFHRHLLEYRIDVNGQRQCTLNNDQHQYTLTECIPTKEYKVQLYARTVLQTDSESDKLSIKPKDTTDDDADETPSKKFRIRTLSGKDILKSLQANFEFYDSVINENNREKKNDVKSLGKIRIQWTVTEKRNISHYILQWRSSKDLRIQQLTLNNNEVEYVLDSCDEKHFYTIELFIITNDGTRKQYNQLIVPVPGAPDAPKLWLVKTTDDNFIIEWSEPKSYGIPIIGFQLFIGGKKAYDIIKANLRRAEIPSYINRTYQVSICAVTNNPQRSLSAKSQTLTIITTSSTNLAPTASFDNTNNDIFNKTFARTIPVQVDSINEEKLYVDWSSFLPSKEIRAYYIQYRCLNNGDIRATKVSKRQRHTVLKGLKPTYTYAIIVMAVDKNHGVLYTSDKTTVQMLAPPNAPWVTIRDRAIDHVTIEWKSSMSNDDLNVIGYKIFINNKLAAILLYDQLAYTLSNGTPCETYTIHVQAISKDKTITSPMSHSLQFTWPGIRPGRLRRINNDQLGPITIAWDDPRLEESDNLVAFKVFSENAATHQIRTHGDWDSTTRQAQIHGLSNGKYRIWLEIQSTQYSVRSRPLSVLIGKSTSQLHRRSSFDAAKCYYGKRQKPFRSSTQSITPIFATK